MDELDGRRPRVVVGVHGSLGSLQALRCAVDQARQRSVELWSVLVWRPPGGEVACRQAPSTALLRDCQQQYVGDLTNAWCEAFGEIPVDVDVHLAVLRGEPGHVLAQLCSHPDDLLVLGAPARNPLRRMITGSIARRCLRAPRCPIMLVPPPLLLGELRGRRGRVTARRAARWLLETDGRTG